MAAEMETEPATTASENVQNVNSERTDRPRRVRMADDVGNPKADQATKTNKAQRPRQAGRAVSYREVRGRQGTIPETTRTTQTPPKTAADILHQTSFDEEDEEELPGFQGYARVFFQSRRDRKDTQILPTNSSMLSRDTYLFVVIDAYGTAMQLYPSEDDQNLIVDPPIELKYFFAARVPGSQTGAALFLRNDDRQFRRYIFRLEFRNDIVVQSPALVYQMVGSSKTVKKSQQTFTNALKKMESDAKRAVRSHEEHAEVLKSEEKKSQDAHGAYLGAINDMTRDAFIIADSFVGLVNESTEEGESKKIPYTPSWGAGYEERGTADADEEHSDSGSDYEDDYFEDEEDGGFSQLETVDQTFQRVFQPVKNRIAKT